MRRWLVLLAALGAAAQAQTPWAGELLLPPADSGFVLGWAAPPTAPVQMREYVPRGETVERWTRLITVQRLPNRPGLVPQGVLARLSGGFVAACPGAVATAVETGALGAHASATVRVDCPRNPQTGLPETMWARAVLGDEAMQLVQAATRRIPTQADAHWARQALDGVMLCGGGTRCDQARMALVGGVL